MADYEKIVIKHLINILNDYETYERISECAMDDDLDDLDDDDVDFDEIEKDLIKISKRICSKLIGHLENLE